MEVIKRIVLPKFSETYMESGDVLLVLDDGVAMICHSHILSVHSSVFRKTFEDTASEDDKRTRISLPNFTESQCTVVLAWLYQNDLDGKPAVFYTQQEAATLVEAVAVARFVHKYDVPHALRHVEAYMTAHMTVRYMSDNYDDGRCYKKQLLVWALMADKLDMHELCGHCERAMMVEWEHFAYRSELADQLSGSALQRIAKGLLIYGRYYPHRFPDVSDFMAWRHQ